MIGIVIGVIAVGFGLWLLFKYFGATLELQEVIALVKTDDPELTDEEATARGAEELNANYLAQLRAQEEETRIAEQAAIVKLLEEELARKQTQALQAQIAEANARQQADTEAIERARQARIQAENEARLAEEQALRERRELEMHWTNDLTGAVDIMNRMQYACESAVRAVESAKNKVVVWEEKIEETRLAVKIATNIMINTTSSMIKEQFASKITNLRIQYLDYVRKLESAKIVLNSTRISANAAIRDAQDATGDVLGLTRIMQNLRILLTLANRTDEIARQTRTNLQYLFDKI